MIGNYFRYFSIAYFILFFLVFAILIYLDSYSQICTISPKTGVSCENDTMTQIVGYIHVWFLMLTSVTANIVYGLKTSSLNFDSRQTLIVIGLVVICWIPFIYGGWSLIRSIYTKLFSMVR